MFFGRDLHSTSLDCPLGLIENIKICKKISDVVRQALKLQKKIIVCINKVDKPASRVDWVRCAQLHPAKLFRISFDQKNQSKKPITRRQVKPSILIISNHNPFYKFYVSTFLWRSPFNGFFLFEAMAAIRGLGHDLRSLRMPRRRRWRLRLPSGAVALWTSRYFESKEQHLTSS